MVEHYLAKVGVTGSSPASRSSLLEASSAEISELMPGALSDEEMLASDERLNHLRFHSATELRAPGPVANSNLLRTATLET